MSELSRALEDYLQLRRALGHKLEDAGRQLVRFVSYLDAVGAETVTLPVVLDFLLDPELDPSTTIPTKRLTAVRGFARHMAGIDPGTEIPPTGLVSYRALRRVPHIFTDDDLAALVRCAQHSTPSPFRKATLGTLIGLLAVTGLRVGEALRLHLADIDWDDAVLLVRDTKFGKGRNVPVSSSTIEALATYVRREDRPEGSTTNVFVSLAGTAVFYSDFSKTFRDAVAAAEIGAGTGVRPRIHDLRHGFAVRTLLGWYRAGLDVEALLPRLSTYLGHRDPRFTYRYLSATPELLGLAIARLEAAEAGSR
jgi:integrase/recombinase XerD